jgi:hypothetical protein
MASKVKSKSRSSIPVARAIPVATAVPLKAASTSANRVLNRIKKTGVWMTSNNWLMVSKLITVVGLIIFAISTASGTVDGELAAYYWMGIGVITTLIMTTVMLSRTSKGEGVLSLLTKMAGLYLPTIATLIVIVVMIMVFHSVRNILTKDAAHLPSEFYTFHYLTFFFLFLQLIMLYQFFGGEMKSILSKGKVPDPYRAAYIAGFILFSIISLGSAAELYVIITRFITDG